MHFERLELCNFGCYYGEHSIDLSCESDKPVVVILGGTGTGKSTLFDAINWALYGPEYEKDVIKKRQRKIVDYVSESAINAVKDGNDDIEMSATLYFEHDGRHYYITQALEANLIKRPSDERSVDVKSQETMLFEIRGGNHKRIPYDSIFLDEVLPNNVRDYFLFDGDRIHNLSKPGSSQEVREAIYRVVDLELIKNAQMHLNQVASEYRRDANRESKGELSDIEAKYGEAREDLEKLKEREDEHKNEDIVIRAQIAALEEKLQNLPDTSELQTRRSETELRLTGLNNQYEELAVSIREEAAISSLGVASVAAMKLIEDINEKREKGLIPKKVSQTLLKDLLEIKKCICETEFEEGDKIWKALNKRLKQEMRRASGQEYINVLIDLQKASERITAGRNNLERYVKTRYQILEAIRDHDLLLKQIDTELENLPKEDVVALTAEVRQRRQDLVSNSRRLERLAYQIEEKENIISDIEKKRDELSKKQKKARALHLREGLAQRAADELERIYEVFAEASREAVEELTKQEFASFVLSASGYHVAVSNDYELQVLDSLDNPALQRLSMGQSQCLSLAFITAISRVSEKNPPLVIDMPFGRLDMDVHDEVSKRLPEIASQIILFLIPGNEWNQITRENLEPKASHIYSLKFYEERREAQIEIVI